MTEGRTVERRYSGKKEERKEGSEGSCDRREQLPVTWCHPPDCDIVTVAEGWQGKVTKKDTKKEEDKEG